MYTNKLNNMKTKIKSVNSPTFFLYKGEVYYEQVTNNSGQVDFVRTGTLDKKFFNEFLENSSIDKKDIYIYSMDDKFVRCCAI
jgi:hypothetical protein